MLKEDKRPLTLEGLQKLAEGMLLEDGVIAPIILLCGRKGTVIQELPIEFTTDEKTHEQVVRSIVQKILDEKVHKVFLVSECWTYELEDGVSTEEMIQRINDDPARYESCRGEGYRVIELTHDSSCMIAQAFERKNKTITLHGEGVKSDEGLDSLTPMQEALYPLE